MIEQKKPSPIGFIAVCAAALFSGAAALSYEITWSRMLVIPLGNSSDSTAIVLMAFMLGMAGGGRLLGGYSDRVKSPIKLYAKLEIALGLYALVTPLFIHLLGNLASLGGNFETSPGIAILRYVVFGVIVTVPSLAMGATLPVLVRAISKNRQDARNKVGIVYGVNTIGAAIGATVAGFFAIPAFGVTLTSTFSVGLSFLSAITALGASRLYTSKTEEASGDPPTNGKNDSDLRRIRAIALLAAFVSGFIMLGGEVLFARVLTFIFGHDTYAFAVLLAVVLVGLGLGGFLHSRLASRDPVTLVSLLLGLMSLALIDSFWVAATITIEAGRDPFNLGAFGNLAGSLRLELIRELLFAPILVFIPAVLAGAAFPAACGLYVGDGKDSGFRIGEVALVNGVGAAAGALLVSFLVVGAIGIQWSFTILGILGAVCSLAILFLGGKLTSFKSIASLGIPAALTLMVALVMPGNLPKAMLLEAVGSNHQRLVHYEEGRTGTVSVTINEINGEKQLFMNAVNEVTTRLVHDQSFKLLGHLGPLLHTNPKQGLMICFGAGLSAGAALVHPLKSLDVVELSSAIPNAAHQWARENNDAIKDPRLKLHIDDGRHFLNGTNKLFDTITVDSTHPKAVDSWILYTRELYELMKSRLAAGGIAVQWVPLHGLSEREFKIIVRTFQSVFRETTLWVNVGFETYGQAAYVKMVGTREPLVIDYKELALRLKEPRIKADLEPFGMDAPEEILDAYLAGPKTTATWTTGLPIQSDNHPKVPYTTEFSKGRRMSASLLLGVRSSVLSILERMGEEEASFRQKIAQASEAQGFLLAGMLDRALAIWPEGKKLKLFEKRSKDGSLYYSKLAKRYSADPKKLFEIGNYLGNLGFAEPARDLYEKALSENPKDLKTRLNLAILLLDLDETDGAIKMLSSLASDVPSGALVHYNLGVARLASNQPDLALSSLKRALEIEPDLLGAKLTMAEAYLVQNKLKHAEKELRDVVAKSRWVAEAWDMLGLVSAKQRDFPKAKKYHMQALELEPYRADAHYNLGIVLQELGQIKEAAGAYQAALKIDPDDAQAHNNLGLVFAAAGLYDRALTSHLEALNVNPEYAEAAFNLGLDYKALGNPLKAAEAFGLALEISPTLTQAKEQLETLGIDKVEIQTEDPTSPAGAKHASP